MDNHELMENAVCNHGVRISACPTGKRLEDIVRDIHVLDTKISTLTLAMNELTAAWQGAKGIIALVKALGAVVAVGAAGWAAWKTGK